MTGAATREAALEPLRAALLTRAGKDADLMRRAAEDDGRKALAAAQERSRQSLANARTQGEAQAALLAAEERSRARRKARGVVLAAQRQAYEELRRQVGDAIRRLLADSGWQDRLNVLLLRQLGAEARIHDQEGGGVVAQSADGRRIDASIGVLVDLALSHLQLEGRWAPK
jgi:vacuolar-type H+-ATPase subunit E/Vma4